MAKPIEYYVQLAEDLAAKNGGFLPGNPTLVSKGYSQLVTKILARRELFEHLLAKYKNGINKEKYGIVEANFDKPDKELAKMAGVSLATVRDWKQRLREDKGMEDKDDTPDDASMEEIAAFIDANMPEGWQLNIDWSQGECFVGLVQPNGKVPKLKGGESMSLTRSIIAHVDFARKKAGLGKAEWGAGDGM